jgi:hypothetical protein
MAHSKTFVSVLILTIIFLQMVPAISYEGPIQTRWPFLMWAMYKNPHPPGPVRALKNRVIGVTESGKREQITGRLVGLPWPAIGRMYVQPMRAGDSTAAQRFFNRLNRNRSDPFVELRMESETFTVTDTGVVRQTNPVQIFRADPITATR